MLAPKSFQKSKREYANFFKQVCIHLTAELHQRRQSRYFLILDSEYLSSPLSLLTTYSTLAKLNDHVYTKTWKTSSKVLFSWLRYLGLKYDDLQMFANETEQVFKYLRWNKSYIHDRLVFFKYANFKLQY